MPAARPPSTVPLRATTPDDLRRIEAKLDRVLDLCSAVAALAVRKDSRKQQARKAGVSRSTLWRRERAMRARLRVEGQI